MTIVPSILMCYREMKIALVLVLCLAAGSQAGFLDDLKNAFSNIGSALTSTVHAVGDQAKVVGQNLLSTAKEQGSQLASQALQSERMLNCPQLKRNCFAFRNVCCLALLPNAVICFLLLESAYVVSVLVH